MVVAQYEVFIDCDLFTRHDWPVSFSQSCARESKGL